MQSLCVIGWKDTLQFGFTITITPLINFNWLHKLCWCKIFLAKYLNLSIPSTIPFACCIIITVRLYLKKSLAIFILFILLLNPWLLNVAEFFLFESHDLHICTFQILKVIWDFKNYKLSSRSQPLWLHRKNSIIMSRNGVKNKNTQ